MAQKRANAVRFDDKLVLNRYMLRLFEVRDFEALAGPLRDPALEGLTEDGAHRYLGALNLLWDRTELPRALLRELDGRLVAHTRALNERRPAPVVWKYFQYLALLFAEVYLERYFRDPGGLRDGLNEELARANADLPKAHRLPDYEPDDLRRLAFWNATGSGKTLLMHVNILQYRARLAAAGRERELNRTILLTPNEGLSRQHLAELAAAGIAARPFRPDAPAGLYDRDAVDVLEVTKLREEAGEKTVAVGAFGGDNLVLVDEGHRGAGSSKDTGWMTYRNRLSESGFAFEYSATFGQAVKGNRALEAAYGKAVLFDYSYKRFYRDGFGKDYRILNLADEKGGEGKGGEGKGAEPGADGERRALYLTACLLTFYQQAALFAARPAAFRPFLLERPLWVFVGASVNAVRTRQGRKVSDVLDVLLFLDGFARGGPAVVARIERLLGGAPGLLDGRGREIFAEAFPYLAGLGRTADQTHADVLRTVFNAPAGAALHVERLKGADGELALRLGGNPPFGVINVGDAATLRKLCEGRGGLVVTDRAIGGSLFAGLADGASSVNVLIGSKKFTEGWNSWRVGTMGLMNVGRSEGPEVVQLFGRGVRLRGKDMTLKRSSRLPFGALSDAGRPEHVGLLETLNVFGVRADYMRRFRDLLEEEGLPAGEDREEFVVPVARNLEGRGLRTVRLPDGRDFRREGPAPAVGRVPEHLMRHPLVLDWYPKLEAAGSAGAGGGSGAGSGAEAVVKHEGVLGPRHLAFLDFDELWFELTRFKAERGWHTLGLERDALPALLADSGWYRLLIPPADLEPGGFDRVRRWAEVAAALLKKYVDRFYKYERAGWEAGFLAYAPLDGGGGNVPAEYRVALDRSRGAAAAKLKDLKRHVAGGAAGDWSFGPLTAVNFGRHLYRPLLHLAQGAGRGAGIEVAPAALNDGERQFVDDLRAFHAAEPDYFADRGLFLLRNLSRGRGVGFFEAGNFHPDFLLWLVRGRRQSLSFVDPKGLRNLDGPDDPKLRFYRTVKGLERRLGDPDTVLNSFIISNTPFRQVRWWSPDHEKSFFTDRHIFFRPDDPDTYIRRLLATATAEAQVSPEED